MFVMFLVWRARRLLRRAVLGVVILAALASLARPAGERSGAVAKQGRGGGACREHGGLPDRRCTPGAIRPGRSLSSVCRLGYSRSVRPPESFTEPLKRRQMHAYDLPGRASAYEEDHLVPLSIGGAPTDPANLWPEPRRGTYNAQQKDRLETWAARMACARRISLSRLQHELASNWVTLYWAAGGERVLRFFRPGG
jgi:hypothetical protein